MELTTGHETLRVTETPGALRVTLSRPERQNSISPVLLRELHDVLDRAESRPDCRVVVLEGERGVFSMGMDFAAASATGTITHADAVRGGQDFLGLLKRFTTTPRVVVAKVDGRVAGGGVGLVAASDFVYATERSQFSLPEALWGLLPCCVAPFLIRRIGFQPAYSMTLSTQPIGGAQALAVRLVDELADDPEPLVRRLTFRMTKIDEPTVASLKRYYQQLWILTEATESAAVAEFARLMSSPTVQGRIADFAATRRMPWEG